MVKFNSSISIIHKWFLCRLLEPKVKSLSRIVHSHWRLPCLTHVKIAFDEWSKSSSIGNIWEEKHFTGIWKILLTVCSVFMKAKTNWQRRVSQSLSRYQSLIGTKMALQFSYVWLHKLDSPSKRRETDGLFWNVKLLPHCENIWNKHIWNNILFNCTILYIKISVMVKKPHTLKLIQGYKRWREGPTSPCLTWTRNITASLRVQMFILFYFEYNDHEAREIRRMFVASLLENQLCVIIKMQPKKSWKKNKEMGDKITS